MAVTSSMPFSNYWDTKTQLQHQTTLLPQRDLGSTISWLPHTTKENKNSHVRSRRFKLKQTRAYKATAPVMSKDELYTSLDSILNLILQMSQIFADYNYEHHKKPYGIIDPLNEKLLEFTSILRDLVNWKNKTQSCSITDEDRRNISIFSYRILDIYDYVFNQILHTANIDTSECQKVSNKVAVLDAFGPLFVWMKKVQAQIACILLKELADNATVSEDTRNSYKKYFDTIIKLYENRTLSNEEDKAAFKESMDFLLKQVNVTQLPSGAKNAITQLTQVFIKIITGEKLTALDKFLILKNAVVLVIHQLNGNTYSLWKDTNTAQLCTSLFPIILNIYISEGFELCHARGGDEWVPPYILRKIFTNVLPSYRAVLSYLVNYLRQTPKLSPFMGKKISSRQDFHEEDVESTYQQLLFLDNIIHGKPTGKIQRYLTQILAPAAAQRKRKHIKLLWN